MFGTISVHMVDRFDDQGNYRGKLNVAGGRLVDSLGRIYVFQMNSKGEQAVLSPTDGSAEYRYRYHIVPVGGGPGRSVETLEIIIYIAWNGDVTIVNVTSSSSCR